MLKNTESINTNGDNDAKYKQVLNQVAYLRNDLDSIQSKLNSIIQIVTQKDNEK